MAPRCSSSLILLGTTALLAGLEGYEAVEAQPVHAPSNNVAYFGFDGKGMPPAPPRPAAQSSHPLIQFSVQKAGQAPAAATNGHAITAVSSDCSSSPTCLSCSSKPACGWCMDTAVGKCQESYQSCHTWQHDRTCPCDQAYLAIFPGKSMGSAGPCLSIFQANFAKGSCKPTDTMCIEAAANMLKSCKGLVVPNIPFGNPTAGAPFNQLRVDTTVKAFAGAGCKLPIAPPTPPPTPAFKPGQFLMKQDSRATCPKQPGLRCNVNSLQDAQMHCLADSTCLWFVWSGPNGGQQKSQDSYPNCVFTCSVLPTKQDWIKVAWKKGMDMNDKGWVLAIRKVGNYHSDKSYPGLFPKLAKKHQAAKKAKKAISHMKNVMPMNNIAAFASMGLSFGTSQPTAVPTPKPTNRTAVRGGKKPLPSCWGGCMPACLAACVTKHAQAKAQRHNAHTHKKHKKAKKKEGDSSTYKGILICAGVLAVIVFSFIANKLDSLDDDEDIRERTPLTVVRPRYAPGQEVDEATGRRKRKKKKRVDRPMEEIAAPIVA